MQSWNFVWSYLGGALISEWVLRLLHGVTGRGAAAWPHSRPAVSIFGGQATTLPIAVLLSAEERLRQIVARSCLAVDGCSKAGALERRRDEGV